MWYSLKKIIQFRISKSETHLVAECMDLAIVTQGKTFDEVIANIKEAVLLYFDDEDPTEWDISPHYSVLIN